jgi:hypothetical protein
MIWTSYVVATSEADAREMAEGATLLISGLDNARKSLSNYHNAFPGSGYRLFQVRHEDVPVIDICLASDEAEDAAERVAVADAKGD